MKIGISNSRLSRLGYWHKAFLDKVFSPGLEILHFEINSNSRKSKTQAKNLKLKQKIPKTQTKN